MKIAISGASGKTGYRVAEEALNQGNDVRLLVRENSKLPQNLLSKKKYTISLSNPTSLDNSLRGCDALIIATGAKPSIDLTGPARIDAIGVKKQIESCKRVNVKRVILVSSLCSGRIFHPLNLFGLILVWKRLGERVLEESSLDWTVIRPGGLNEREDDLKDENVKFTGPDQQEDAYIPRRLVAKCCIEALVTSNSIGKIIEITSNTEQKALTMEEAIESFTVAAGS
ncbi:SDR family oxidoreductase [Prochlorococcus sp. MIT 1307]|uniref:SDR family oxidoreductase n=1 Tax=Prochlorococcus sp. MIT 1307 TaxID=3096219 RepID=UPI002A74E086|nr:SDR family oxidoreductase [Prochlorococcus sp. MIT 1307]